MVLTSPATPLPPPAVTVNARGSAAGQAKRRAGERRELSSVSKRCQLWVENRKIAERPTVKNSIDEDPDAGRVAGRHHGRELGARPALGLDLVTDWLVASELVH